VIIRGEAMGPTQTTQPPWSPFGQPLGGVRLSPRLGVPRVGRDAQVTAAEAREHGNISVAMMS